MHGPEAFGFLNSEKLCVFAPLREITLNWDEWNWQRGQLLSQGPGSEECLAQRRKAAKEEERKKPRVVEVMSSWALASGVVVPMPTWAWAASWLAAQRASRVVRGFMGASC